MRWKGQLNPEDNRRHAIACYELMFNDGKSEEAMDRYAGDRDILHNPPVPGTCKVRPIGSRRSGFTAGDPGMTEG